MKTKTRKLIGKILVWGGLGIVTITSLLMIYKPYFTFVGLVTEAPIWNLFAVISLLIGGLWGMKK